MLDLIQQQMDEIDAIDTAQSTTFAAEIQADLDTLDTLDAAYTTEQGSSSAGLKKADVLEWFEGGKTDGFGAEMRRIADRVARVLSQSFEDSRAMAGMTPLERS